MAPKKAQGRDKIKLDIGTLYRNRPGGKYHFRYQLNGMRKSQSLGTNDEKKALEEAQKLLAVLKAPSIEVVAAHVNHAKKWEKKKNRLQLRDAWDVYDRHPDRASPATVNIYQRYDSYFRDFVSWATDKGIVFLDEVTDTVVGEYVELLKTQPIGVDTHNKRISRISKIFRTLSVYTTDSTSDWSNRNFRRKPREEIGMTARRLPFTREQEEKIFTVLEDPTKQCKNKHEIKVLFYLGAYTGQRMKDCALLQWHKVDMRRRRIQVVQFKTGKEVTIPIAPQLMQVLEEAREWECNSYVLPKVAKRYLKKNSGGKDIGSGFVNNDVMRVIRWTGIEPNQKVEGRAKAVSVYGFHSLRHSFVSFCIENNISKAVAVSILGADSDIIDQYYTHIGEEAQEQAIQLISGNGSTMKQRHQEALAYLDSIETKTPELERIDSILRG